MTTCYVQLSACRTVIKPQAHDCFALLIILHLDSCLLSYTMMLRFCTAACYALLCISMPHAYCSVACSHSFVFIPRFKKIQIIACCLHLPPIFGPRLSDGVIYISPLMTPVAMATNFGTKLTTTWPL